MSLFILVAATCFNASFTQIEGEGWLVIDSRLPIHQGADGKHEVSLRLQADFRLANRSHGLQQALGRFGVMWSPVSAITLAAQVNANLTTNDGKRYVRDTRLETEATFSTHPASWLSLSHRQRFEIRFNDAAAVHLRHRLLVRANVMPSWRVYPFVWSETFLVVATQPIDQQRWAAGVVWRLRPSLTVEFGALLRLRPLPSTKWEPDVGPRIAIAFQPLFDHHDEGSGTE